MHSSTRFEIEGGFVCVAALLLCATRPALAQGRDATPPTHADSVRGAGNRDREWWDVTFYDLHVRVNPTDSSFVGWNGITYRVRRPAQTMQLDLQAPLVLDSVVQEGERVEARREENAYFLTLPARASAGDRRTVTAYYHGQPGRGRPERSSGVVWSRDSLGSPWFATSDELPGASIWWPLKDYLGEEPDSQRIAVTVPDSLIEVSNGRLRSTTHNADGTTTYEWFVTGPINSYGVAVNAGRYGHFADTVDGVAGRLSLDFWPLAAHLDTAKVQWAQATSMLACFERWFGPYPWYADGYKLVETPYLGMEHQSGIAYGNKFLPGYLGRDLSGTGLGLGWDYIVIHESAHEWFGNSISTREPGDLWVHEAFATYAEGLYVECQHGRTAGAAYLIGLRKGIRNTGPVVGPHGVAGWYNTDMYSKGANVLHTIRQLVDDDAKWHAILLGLTRTFRHRLVTGAEIEDYIASASGLNLRPVFAQYFTTTRVPALEYRVEHGRLSYRWAGVVTGFAMPVRVQIPGVGNRWLRPTATWQRLTVPSRPGAGVTLDENFYVTSRNLAAARLSSFRCKAASSRSIRSSCRAPASSP
jgi:aminopeptidase N